MKNVGFFLFASVLVFSPLVFGAVEQWSLTVMETLIFISLIVWMTKVFRKDSSFNLEVPGRIPLLILISYILFQMVPLPAEFVKMISPNTFKLYKDTLGIFEQPSWMSLSLNRRNSLIELFRISSYAAFYLLTVRLLTGKSLMQKTVNMIVIFATAISMFAILSAITGSDVLFSFKEFTQKVKPYGTYVNPNHYAGFMNMIFPIALSLIFIYKPAVGDGTLRQRTAEVFNSKGVNLYMLLWFAVIIIAASIVFSASRGGIISLIISIFFFAAVYLIRERKKGRLIYLIAVIVLIAIFMSRLGWEKTFSKFESLMDSGFEVKELRPVIWKDSIKIIREFPVTGTGFGTFVNIYPKYRTLTAEGILEHAHNDYLEFLVEGGIISAAILFCFIFTVVRKSFRIFVRRKDPAAIYLYTGVLSGVISMLVHAASDFNLHIGANGLYFFLLMGLLVSSAGTKTQNNHYVTLLKGPVIRHKTSTFALLIIFSLCMILMNAGMISGEHYFSKVKEIKIAKDLPEGVFLHAMELTGKAYAFDPLNARYTYALAEFEHLLGHNKEAESLYRKTLRKEPVNSEYLQGFGMFKSLVRQSHEAERLMQAGIKFDVTNPSRYNLFSAWLFSVGKKEDAVNNLKKAITLNPELTDEFIAVMVIHGLDNHEIRNAMPEKIKPYIIFADYLKNTGERQMAGEVYLQALTVSRIMDELRPEYFYKAYNFFVKENNYQKALAVMQQASSLFPDDMHMRLNIAWLYERLDDKDNAIKEYKKVLRVAPDNEKAQTRLKKLAGQ